ncbi:Uncharacterised protein g9069 [Pycnogonum litorale]
MSDEKASTTAKSIESDWEVPYSDEDIVDDEKTLGIWHPKPSIVIELFNELKKVNVIELEWQCPGRRSPSVHNAPESPQESAVSKSNHVLIEADEFDFGDDSGTLERNSRTPQRGLRNISPGSAKLKGSAQKRVAKFGNVMFNIRKHRELNNSIDSYPQTTVANSDK